MLFNEEKGGIKMKGDRKLLLVGLVAIAFAVALGVLASQGQESLAANGIIYVDADAAGANNGTSWDDAYTELQPALAAAAAGTQIWVAEGTYKPSWEFSPGDPRSATFQMKNGVAIYGGFAGSESSLADRDWVGHVTVLSGDIGAAGVSSDNSYHVFYHPSGTALEGTAILDGFTVSGGNANGDMSTGGGMVNNYSSPTLINCTFSGNLANYGGGGMANGYSSPTLTNCTFVGNSAMGSNVSLGGGMLNYHSSPVLTGCTFSNNLTDYGGGGMYNADQSSPTLDHCTFSQNSAYSYGGGMYNYGSSAPVLTDCTFVDNSANMYGAPGWGGGMFNDDESSPSLTGCTFTRNVARYDGGAMFNSSWSSPTLTDCIFTDNSALEGGGGGLCNTMSSPTLINCSFSGNDAALDGGGVFNHDSSPALTNCAFSGNSAGQDGGALYNQASSSPTLTNCTFSGNAAEQNGGALYNYWYSSPTVTNSILWGNTPQEIYNNDAESAPVVSYSNLQGGYTGVGNINGDPLFVNAANGDLHLLPGSPCIDTGNNAAPDLPAVDFEGDARILDGDGDGTATIDMGVDEHVPLSFRTFLPLVTHTVAR